MQLSEMHGTKRVNKNKKTKPYWIDWENYTKVHMGRINTQHFSVILALQLM